MRLWHQELINKLPRQQLLGQHRECCALRGKGWGKKHSTVDYVFENDIEKLVAYHLKVINEMKARGYNPNPIWEDGRYRGKKVKYDDVDLVKIVRYKNSDINIYDYHNDKYLEECIDNLYNKGCICPYIEGVV